MCSSYVSHNINVLVYLLLLIVSLVHDYPPSSTNSPFCQISVFEIAGDLKEPSKAIPKGTLSAAMVAMATYIVLSFMCSATVDRYVLYTITLLLTYLLQVTCSLTIHLLTLICILR